MKERVDVGEWVEFQWPYLISFLGGAEQVRELAYASGAFTRARKIEEPELLLRLLLMWTVGGQSLMSTAAWAEEADLVDVSDVALVKRFLKCGDWLGRLLGEVLIDTRAELPPGLRVRVIDATAVNRAGTKGTDHRVHLGMDLRLNQIDSIELTSIKGGESFERFEVRAGEVLLADAGYAQRKGLGKVAQAGAFFVVRFPWSNLPLENHDGGRFPLLEALRTLPEAQAVSFPVQFRAADGERIECRVVGIRKSEPAASEARRKALRVRSKNGEMIDIRTLEAAEYTFVLTNLPDSITADSVLQLYRFRWQIEMKFKTLKSVIHLGRVPSRTAEGLRVHVLAKLLIALLIDSLIYQAESFSPWGYPLPPHQRLARDAQAS
ncbi:MAG: IS4 family transposase [Gemmatimonadaceae bacterium]